jgi:hypothetical protein
MGYRLGSYGYYYDRLRAKLLACVLGFPILYCSSFFGFFGIASGPRTRDFDVRRIRYWLVVLRSSERMGASNSE